jgi:hypothetical protein
LFDGALIGEEGVFDGVFDGDDVAEFAFVDGVDHSGEGGGFTAACGSGEKDEATWEVGEFVDDVWEEEFFDVSDLVVDGTEGEGDGVSLVVCVDAEASDAWDFVGEVGVAEVFEGGDAFFVDHFLEDAEDAFGGHDGEVGGFEDGVDAEERRESDVHVDVRGFVLYGGSEDVVELAHTFFPFDVR